MKKTAKKNFFANLSYNTWLYNFVSARLAQGKDKAFSGIITRIAIASISIGLAILIVAFGVLEGFRNTIHDKIFSFVGHIQVTQFNSGNSYKEKPINTNTRLFKNYKNTLPNVETLHAFSMKPGIFKTSDEVMGVLLKGIGTDYTQSKFTKNMVKGRFLKFPKDKASKELIISQKIAHKLHLKVNDSIYVYFVQDPPAIRKLHIVGIYESGMEEFDEKFVLSDIRLIQKLNRWADTLVGGYEVFINDFRRLDSVQKEVFEEMEYDMQMQTTPRKYEEIFDWLTLLNTNVKIFLWLILIVACFNMISIFLIMIMERINMIGVLKAIGATNSQIKSIFLMRGIRLIFRGMLIGNLVGLGICALQYYLHLIPLDPENYYMDTVPIDWNWGVILTLNLLIFALILVILIPATFISTVRPIKAIRFD
ncbi:FtsX-like permease family protein [uncultured Microscilla sp.]|uniref:ABC transporter permease n=1 Tax=uncultured Microscilla sp. TaxID=432653 RepID=UPI00262BB226|nr:FtsX-like permease family protein [uncultured Microscilla sp.]